MAGLPAPAYWPQDAKDLKDRLAIGYIADTSVELYRPILTGDLLLYS